MDELRSDLYLTYQFYISGEKPGHYEVISKEKLPLDVRDYISCILEKKIIITKVDAKQVEKYFKKALYHNKTQASHIAGDMGEGTGGSSHESLEVNFNDAPIIKLVNSILQEAIDSRASDIHIEPQDGKMKSRYRIDGDLHTVLDSPLNYFPAVSSRIKFLARLDVTQKLTPQDGKAQVEVNGAFLDLRVSTIPTKYGESIVIRILNREESFIDLAQLGLEKDIEKETRRLLELKNGLILLTGPTGSGKTTTLYSMLKILNKDNTKIVTVENPVEFEIGGISQVEVNELQGITFPSILRNFLRHDPDVIMIGEIRDEETARIAIQASLTGHLVLSTLHTNDAISALTRLMDLGIEPYLIASSLKGVFAQRLVKRLCEKCSVKENPAKVNPDLKLVLKKNKYTSLAKIKKTKGCAHCRKTGYFGRIAVMEYIPITKEVQDRMTANNPEKALQEYLRKGKHKNLSTHLMEKFITGVTSADELQKYLFH